MKSENEHKKIHTVTIQDSQQSHIPLNIFPKKHGSLLCIVFGFFLALFIVLLLNAVKLLMPM
jgi:hypothetical protein